MNQDEEIFAAYREWAAAQDAYEGAVTEEENEAIYARARKAEAKVLSFTPSSARAMAIQIMVFTAFGEFTMEASNTFDMEAFVEQIALVERPASFRREQVEKAA